MGSWFHFLAFALRSTNLVPILLSKSAGRAKPTPTLTIISLPASNLKIPRPGRDFGRSNVMSMRGGVAPASRLKVYGS